MNTYRSLSQLVGHTPLLEAVRYRELAELPANLFLKLESFNPSGSAKDRVALHMIETAEADGRLTPGGVIIEPTSGNTGIGLAAIGIARGYRVIPHHARLHERRAARPARGLRRRAGAHPRQRRHGGCHRQGRGAGGGAARQLHRRAV